MEGQDGLFPKAEIKFQILATLGTGRMPTRAHADDAGYDLYTSEPTVIPPGAFVDVPTAVALQLPDGAWGFLTGRSSTLRKRGLLVHTGIIDTGYRGELFAGAWNLTEEPVTIEEGERIAQIIILTNATMETIMVQGMLDRHERGVAGFGSSGS